MRFFLGMLLLLGACGIGLCRPVPVSGIVLDPSQAGVAGARVSLHGGSSGEPRTITADAEGAFRFDGVPSGRYEVMVQHEGFKPAAALP